MSIDSGKEIALGLERQIAVARRKARRARTFESFARLVGIAFEDGGRDGLGDQKVGRVRCRVAAEQKVDLMAECCGEKVSALCACESAP